MKVLTLLFSSLIVLVCVHVSAQPRVSPSPTLRSGKPRQTGVEVIAKFPNQPTHLARTSDGRIFTVLYSAMSGKSSLVEVLKDGKISAYPDANWNAGRQPYGTGFSQIAGLKAGRNGWLGVIDAGDAAYSPRVILWDTRSNKLIASKEMSGIKRQAGSQRFVQDLALDVPHKCIYTVATSADRKSGTVLVFDVGRDAVRSFTIWKGDTPEMAVAADKTELKDTASLRSGMEIPIAIDPSYKWVYMGGLGKTEIYRVDSAVLADPDLTADVLLKKLEKYGTKAVGTHMVADDAGNVYCAEAATNRIGMFSPDRQYRVFLQDALLNYPYDLALAPEGYIYISVNQIQRLNEKGKTEVDQNHPFLIVRTKALPSK